MPDNLDPDLDEATGRAAYETFGTQGGRFDTSFAPWDEQNDETRRIFIAIAQAVLQTATYHGSQYGPDESPF
jgi:hypothetical protein